MIKRINISINLHFTLGEKHEVPNILKLFENNVFEHFKTV